MEPDDAALVEGFLSRGAEDCFEILVGRYRDRIFRLALSVMGPGFSAEAEDVTQEVFIQVYRKLSSFRGESSFATWLYRLARNRALEHRRRARFRFPHQGESVLKILRAPAEGSDPVKAGMTGQRERAVLDGLASLDEPYRTAIHLYYWMKYPVSRIAEHLGTRPGTVKSYLHRGRKRLARTLKKERENE